MTNTSIGKIIISSTILAGLLYVGFQYVVWPMQLSSKLEKIYAQTTNAENKYPFLAASFKDINSTLSMHGKLNFPSDSGILSAFNPDSAWHYDDPYSALKYIEKESFFKSSMAVDFLRYRLSLLEEEIRVFHADGYGINTKNVVEDMLRLANGFVETCVALGSLCDYKAHFPDRLPSEWEKWFQNTWLSADNYVKFVEPGKKKRFVLTKLPKGFLTLCNFAPYESQHLVVKRDNGIVSRVADWVTLVPGECKEYVEIFFNHEPEFYVHTNISDDAAKIFQHVNAIRNKQLLSDDNQKNDEMAIDLTGKEFQYFGELLGCSDTFYNLIVNGGSPKKSCDSSKYHGYFASAYSYGKPSRWYFFLQSPNIYLLPVEGTVKDAISVARKRAQQLSSSINRQMFNQESWNGVPFSFGGYIYDFNGPLNPGVNIVNTAAKDIFGDPLGIVDGDIIEEINGHPVFGVNDAKQLLINHGLSREHGIEIPVSYKIIRNREFYNVKSHYFFNESYRSYSKDEQKGIAFWYGVGDAIVFGQTPEIACYGNNLVRLGLNVLSGAAEGISSIFEERKFNTDRFKAVNYIDAEECTWQKEQNRALSRQLAEETYVNSQWFAVFTPSGLRAVVGRRALERKVARAVGRGAFARGVTDAALEAVETALWSFGTASPGAPFNARAKEAIRLAPIGAAAGFITSVALSHGVKRAK